ncbi:MAG TPA: TIGR00159 family protein [Firmicutes bacterium]|nr:TIGR00159 family protein [Bacillota bacterium]
MTVQWLAGRPRFGLVDVVDILIIAYVVYKVVVFLRNTGTVSLLKGLTVLFVATTLSGWLGLRAVNWLLERALTGIVVALPVVFYPELRRTLEQLGRGQLFRRGYTGLGRQERRELVAAIVRAVGLMSAQRIGALLVLERETGLQEYMDTGIPLDARITAEFLVNVFTPNTPLHDGAALIRGNRLAAAGCFLPLSDNPGLSKDLGTRHRAGVGISEISDAAVVIVSEETGIISLAVNGRLERHLDAAALEERLVSLLRTKEEAQKWWGEVWETGRRVHG